MRVVSWSCPLLDNRYARPEAETPNETCSFPLGQPNVPNHWCERWDSIPHDVASEATSERTPAKTRDGSKFTLPRGKYDAETARQSRRRARLGKASTARCNLLDGAPTLLLSQPPPDRRRARSGNLQSRACELAR